MSLYDETKTAIRMMSLINYANMQNYHVAPMMSHHPGWVFILKPRKILKCCKFWMNLLITCLFLIVKMYIH